QGTTVHLVRTALVFALYCLVFKNITQVGDVITLMFFSFAIFNPMQELGNVIATYNETKVSMDNFAKLIHSESEAVPERPATLGEIKEVTFKNLSFGHKSSMGYAVKDINLESKTGQTVDFVGPSGSGKTTLVKLLLGLYKPNEGNVLYNNIEST